MAGNTIRLHRVLKAPPERIYKAILDPAANCKWLPPHGFTCTVHHLDAKVGGTFKMSFTNFSTPSAASISNWNRGSALSRPMYSTTPIFLVNCGQPTC